MAEHNSIEYRDIEGYPGYRVGNDGSVWSRWRTCRWGKMLTDNWHRMKPSVQKERTEGRRYLYLNLVRDGVATTFRVHRLILMAFVGSCPEGMECRHLDGNPANNALDNLEWGTPQQNADDRKVHKHYTHRNRLITHDGKTMLLKEWASHLSIPYACLYQRIRKLGMTFEEAIARPHLGTSSNGGHWTRAKRLRASGPSESTSHSA